MLAVVMAAAALGGASADPGAAGSRPGQLCDAPRKLRFEVEAWRGPEGEPLISMSGEFESLFLCPMDEILGTLRDFEEWPGIFKNLESVRVRSDEGSRVVTEQTVAVRVAGLSYVSRLAFENVFERPGPSSATFSFKAIELDASMRSSTGAWVLEDASGASGAATRVRYSMDLVMERTIPGQELAVRGFGAGSTKDVLRQLAKAIERRRGSG